MRRALASRALVAPTRSLVHWAALAGFAALATFALAGCGEHDPPTAGHAVRRAVEGATMPLALEADAAIARLAVTVSDAYGTREVEFRRESEKGLLAGAIEAASGESSVAFSAYDADGNLTHEGKGTLVVKGDVVPQQTFVLAPVPGADAASVRIGTYRLALTPNAIEGEPGTAYDVEATLLDAYGERHPIAEGSLEWRPTEGQKESVDVSFGYKEMIAIVRLNLRRWYPGWVWICQNAHELQTCGWINVGDPTPVVQLAAGTYHTCALRKSGRVTCWGSNNGSQLGVDASGTSQLAPIVFTSISSSNIHTCGIDNTGAVRCWGVQINGTLGPSVTTVSSAYPVVIPGLPAAAREVAAGSEHSCALLVDDSTWCWGLNNGGQLGDSSAAGATPVFSSAMPVRVKVRARFTTISAGKDVTCGIDTRGAAWCWGNDNRGKAGTDSFTSDVCPLLWPTLGPVWRQQACAATPRRVQSTVAFRGIGVGRSMSCAWTSTGDGYCWGHPYFTSPAPGGQDWLPQTQAGMPTWTRFLGGDNMQCGTDTSAMIYCLGGNSFGELGAGLPATLSAWVTTPTPIARVDQWSTFDLGAAHACAVRNRGFTVDCWGNNDKGQLGSVTPSGIANVPTMVTVQY